MNQAKTDPNYPRDIIFWAGISAILVAIGYLIISIAYTISGFPLPNNSQDWITYLNGKTNLWQIIIWGSILTDILYIFIAFGFMQYFKKNSRFLTLVASAFFILFVVLELAGTWSIYPTILELYKNYNLTSSPSEQAIYLSAIEYGSTHFQTTANAFYAIILPSLATILYCFVMLKDKATHKVVPLIGLIAGTCNIVSVFGGLLYTPLKQLVVPGSFLSLFWFLDVGIFFVRQSKVA